MLLWSMHTASTQSKRGFRHNLLDVKRRIDFLKSKSTSSRHHLGGGSENGWIPVSPYVRQCFIFWYARGIKRLEAQNPAVKRASRTKIYFQKPDRQGRIILVFIFIAMTGQFPNVIHIRSAWNVIVYGMSLYAESCGNVCHVQMHRERRSCWNENTSLVTPYHFFQGLRWARIQSYIHRLKRWLSTEVLIVWKEKTVFFGKRKDRVWQLNQPKAGKELSATGKDTKSKEDTPKIKGVGQRKKDTTRTESDSVSEAKGGRKHSRKKESHAAFKLLHVRLGQLGNHMQARLPSMMKGLEGHSFSPPFCTKKKAIT